ncbi:MAG: SusC/RagA family TonB-linked outer membrane protein [Chryseolinea sp.]
MPLRTTTQNNYSVAQRHRPNWQWSNTVTYAMSFGKSRLNLLAGMEAVKNQTRVVQVQRLGYAVEDQDYYTISSGTGVVTSQENILENQLVSYFGQVGYAFNDKYLLNATVRYDGSSRFGRNNQFGLFPAGSIGWAISKESFMQNGLPIVSNLKLRVGYGRVGNQEFGNYGALTFFRTNYGTVTSTRPTGTAYDINAANTGTLPSGYVLSQTGNPDLKWETTDEFNAGVDFGFAHQKITGSFDYFHRNTSGILITPPVSAVRGEGATKTVNGATVENQGFEFLIAYNDSKGDFTYGIEANAARFMDKVTYLPPTVVRSYPSNAEKTIIGHSMNSVLGYVADGLFKTQEEVDAHAVQAGKGVGRIKYKDLNGDGKIDPLDQDWLGTTLPGFTYGINLTAGYKRFSLSIFTRGVAFINVNDGNIGITDFFGTLTGVNHGTRLLNAWTPQNPNSDIPAASNGDANTETKTSTYLRVRGDYFKVQDIQLDYRLPLAKWKLTAARIYVIADNTLLFFNKNGGTGMNKPFTGPDPETPGTTYPRPIRFTLGLDFKF